MAAGSISLSAVPSALISWAHRDPDWTDEQAEDWAASVVTLARLLLENGVDAELDLWHSDDPAVDWTRWGTQQVNDREYTIVALSSAWRERWDGTNNPLQGAGAVAEADTLKGRFSRDQEEFQRRTILVLLPGVPPTVVPADLQRLYRIQVADLTQGGIKALLRAIHKAPSYVKPSLGPAPVLTPVDHQSQPSKIRPTTVPTSAITAWNDKLQKVQAEQLDKHFITSSSLADEAALLKGALRGTRLQEQSPITPSREIDSEQTRMALRGEIDSICISAQAQGWEIRNRSKSKLRLLGPRGQDCTFYIGEAMESRVRLRKFASELRACGLRINQSVRKPVDAAPELAD